MKSKRTKTIRDIFAEGTLIDEALNQAVRDAVQKHREAGQPLAVCRDGKTVWVQPKDVESQEDGAKPAIRRSRRRSAKPRRRTN